MSTFLFKQSGGGSGGGISAWVTSTAYVAGNLITYSQDIYTCIVSHTSGGTFEADVVLGKWKLISDNVVQNENLIIVGGDFSAGVVSGWTATGCATITNGLPVTVGSGGTAFLSTNGGRTKGANTTAPAVTSSSPIDGIYSLNLATSGAGTIGDGYISQAIPISTAYQAKALTVTFKYKSASGAPVMSGTSANTYACAIYDVTNNAWIGMAGNFNFIQTSGVGDFAGTFQTASNTAAIQIFVYSPVAPVGASSLLLDNFYVGQQATQKAPAMSDWVAYTPNFTGFGSQTSVNFFWKRSGHSVQIYGNFTTGALTNAEYRISLPSGLVSDPVAVPVIRLAGPKITTGAVNQLEIHPLIESGVSYLTFGLQNSGNAGLTKLASNANMPSGSTPISLMAEVPIAGWSSNSVMSSDTDTREVSAQYYVSSSTAFNSTQINFDTKIFDSHSAVTTGASWKLTAPVSGRYRVSMIGYGQSSTHFILYKNGSNYAYLTPTSNAAFQTGSITLPLNAGDYIDVRTDASVTVTGSGVPYQTYISIERLSGPAVVAASETISFMYGHAAATAVTSITTMACDTKTFDSHNAVVSGVFTAPASGRFHFDIGIAVKGATFILNDLVQVDIVQAGSAAVTRSVKGYAAAAVTQYPISFSTEMNLLAGDTVQVKITSARTGSTLSGTVNENFFGGFRIGI